MGDLVRTTELPRRMSPEWWREQAIDLQRSAIYRSRKLVRRAQHMQLKTNVNPEV